MYSSVNNGCEHLVIEKRKDHNRISNDEVVNLFYSIYEDFGLEPVKIIKKVESILDRKKKLHDIICSKLRFPSGSVLKGNFNANCFKVEVVNDVEEDMIDRECELSNLTHEYVFETYKKLEQKLTKASVQERFDKLRQILCEKIGIVNEIVDSFNLKLKVINKMRFLKRLKERRQNEKIERLMESVFYLPVRKKNLLKELRNRAENIDLVFLQKQNKELTNGLLVDVFKAVNKDVKELRKVLCSQFTKLSSVKLGILSKTAVKTMDKAENLKESGLDGKLKEFMNLPPFETLYSRELSPFCTQETNGDQTEHETDKCGKSLDDKCMSCETLGTKSLPGVSNVDTKIEDAYSSDSTLEEDQEPLLLDVQTDCDIEDEIENKKKRKAYDNAFKLTAIKYAERTSNRAAARKFCVGEKNVRYWRKSKDIILKGPKNKKKNVSLSQDLTLIENDLCKWFVFCQKKGVVLGKKEIMTKGKVLARDPKYKVNTSCHFFGTTWCDRFLKSNNLTLCRKKRRGKVLGLSQCKSTDETGNGESEENEIQASKDFKDADTRKEPTDEGYMDGIDAPSSLDMISVVVENDIDNSQQLETGETVIMKSRDNSSEQGIKLEVIGTTSDVGIDKGLNNSLNETNNTTLKSANSSFVSDSIKIKDVTDDNYIKMKENVTGRGVKRKHSPDKTTCNTNNGEMKGRLEKANVAKNRNSESKTFVNEDRGDKDKTNLKAFEDDLVLLVQENQKPISVEYLISKAKSLYDRGNYGLDFSDSMLSSYWAQEFLERHKLVRKTKDRSAEHITNIETSAELRELPPTIANESEVTDMLDEQERKRPRQSYDFAFKSSVISFAESSSNPFAASVFKVSEKNIRYWRKAKESILEGGKDRKRCASKIRPPYEELENDLTLWCKNIKKSGKQLIRSEVIVKASQLAKEGNYNADMSQFQASNSWCTNFFRRQGLTGEDGRSYRGKKQELYQTDVETVDDIDVDNCGDNTESDDDDE